MIKLRQIEVLHAILSTGSVTAAANVLNVSQPAVSKQLQQAEQQLGFRLFVRDRNHIRATEEALALYREIEQVLPNIEAIQRLAGNLKRGAGKTLRVISVPSLGQTLLPAAFAALRATHTSLDIELRTQHTQELTRSLILREADLGFDFGGFDHPAIKRRALLDTEYVCITPSSWFASGKILTVGDLSTRSRIRMPAADPLSRRLTEHDAHAWEEIPSWLSVQNFHAALEMVGKGHGFALVDPFTALMSGNRNVSTHRLQPTLGMQLYCLTLRNRPISAIDHALATNVENAGKSVLAVGGRTRKQVDPSGPERGAEDL
ncbi:LysR family transcriptional regulator [Xanthobacteraceae bacterium Astr-EGSB]|uniref:LysR family transcriptional regulator n=1 Tax=Astrobacterium formosum TaxID=3069710 RepID=UPI0027B6ECA1|nr:LysR family transcriptional regulator [Xanthobacteraceae bacterium Astr-EGSB]